MTKDTQNNIEYMEKIFRPSVAVDILIFTISDNKLKVLLINRLLPPYQNTWAIPGGFIKKDESLDEAAKRELSEETGITAEYLEQLYTFGTPKRDPRERVISIAYFALISGDKIGNIKADSDASEAKWFDTKELPELAFDHAEIIQYALQRLKWKMEYTNVVYSLLSEEFTLTELQKVYEIIFGHEFDKRNFRKKIAKLALVEPTGKKVVKGVHRPARTYRFKEKGLSFVDIT